MWALKRQRQFVRSQAEPWNTMVTSFLGKSGLFSTLKKEETVFRKQIISLKLMWLQGLEKNANILVKLALIQLLKM